MTSSPKTMRAAVIAEPKRIVLETVPLPEPEKGQVRIRLEGCGICGSNLPVWEGREWFQYPLAPGNPGHEGWGVVDALGAGVEGFKVGDRVATLSAHAYAEYDVADAASLIRLPEALKGVPFPAEPLGCVMNVFARSDIQPEQDVAILGIGFLGALLTQLAVKKGARVIAITRRPFALELARQMGAAETIVFDDWYAVIDRVKELTGGKLCPRVIEAVGTQGPLTVAGEITGERGRLIIAGYHQDGLREVNMQLWNWRGLDVINAHERDPQVYLRGMQAAVDAVLAGDLDPAPLYTHRYGLENISEAFDAMNSRPDGFLKALVTL